MGARHPDEGRWRALPSHPSVHTAKVSRAPAVALGAIRARAYAGPGQPATGMHRLVAGLLTSRPAGLLQIREGEGQIQPWRAWIRLADHPKHQIHWRRRGGRTEGGWGQGRSCSGCRFERAASGHRRRGSEVAAPESPYSGRLGEGRRTRGYIFIFVSKSCVFQGHPIM